jgi:succinate dehydrogenase / fumarate reductase flavoprotein subunit
MFDDIPDNYKAQTADNEEEGWRYTQGDKNARRPPELLTRDHVARCINREVKEGRGSPHGGVFLDIAWIKRKHSNAAEHIKKKLPSMYHQFKQLADIDITKEPMEVGPTTHYMMGGVSVDAETQMSTCRACSRPANAPRDCTEPTGWAAIRSRTSWCSASARASTPRNSRRKNRRPVIRSPSRGPPRNPGAVRARKAAENPYSVQHELQDFMQDLVGIVRTEKEMEQALEKIADSARAPRHRRNRRNREYNRAGTRPRSARIC